MPGMLTQWLPEPDAGGPICCATCGCRLVEAGDEAWQHFPSLAPEQDARGCRPACVAAVHDRWGHAIAETVAA